MRKFLFFIVSLVFCACLGSCVMTASAQSGEEFVVESDVSMVVRVGTPYYNVDGMLVYYIYRGMYYYPFYSNGRYCFHRYVRPVPRHLRHRYVPVGVGNRHRNGHGGSFRPNGHRNGGSIGNRPPVGGHGVPNVGGSHRGAPRGGGFGGRR